MVPTPQQPMAKTVSIRTSLLTNLIATVVFLAVAILATTMVGTRRAVRSLSESIVARTLETVEVRLDSFFADPVRQLLLTQRYALDGLLDQDPDRLLVPLIETYPQVSSAMLADGRGREHMLLRAGTQWRQRTTRRDEWGDEVRWIEWSAIDPLPRERREQLGYDPRTRPWYIGAFEARDEAVELPAIHWTEPYTFFTTQEPGITASVTWDAGDGIDRVIGFDILLNDITEFTLGLQVGDRGKVAVLTADRRFLGLPRDPRFDDPEARAQAILKHASELGVELIADAAAVGTDADPGFPTIRFHSGGEPWWGQVAPYELAPGLILRVAIVMPERELLGHIAAQRLIFLGILLALLAVGVLRAVWLSRRFSTPIEALVAESDRMSRGDLEPGPPIISNVAEVQRLAQAHAQAREGLRALIRLEKVERDLSLARDIQQGLLPDKSPEIPGFEIAGWNRPADKTGGDYYDWMTLPNGRTIMTLADVTGHGIGPALIVAVCRAYMRASTAFGPLYLTEAMGNVNDLLYHDTPPERFVTAAVAVIDPTSRQLTIVSAGQGPILFYEAKTGEVAEWHSDVPPLGVIEGMEFPKPRQLIMEPGDVLALTTDGFFEWCNAAREAFGTARLTTFVKDHHDLAPDKFIEALYRKVLDHADGTEQADDLTAVILRAC